MCNKLKQTKFYQKTAAVCKKGAERVAPVLHQHKRMVGVAAAVILFLLAASCFTPCGSGKIGVLDVDRLRGEAAAYKTIAAEQQKYEELWKMKFMAEKEVLDKEDQELAAAAKAKKMKPGELRRAIEELQKKALALQKKYQAEAAKILAASKSVLTQVDELMLQAASTVAEKKGYDVVIPDRVIYASDRADITDDVIKALNKKSIQIKYPDPQTLTPADMD